ncbi:MAG: hypothetical protein KF712_14205 [Akkermansiaceae bacterium]|nr:hypothetical protein [Akkermansiaceae bacterium]
MTDTDGGSDLIRADSRGRVLVPAAHREVLLDAFERSGQSAMAFSRPNQTSPSRTGFSAGGKRKDHQHDGFSAFAEVIMEALPGSGDATPLPNRFDFPRGMDSMSTWLPASILPWWPSCCAIFPPPGPMLTLSAASQHVLALEPCDMRKSFDSFHALVVTHLGEDLREVRSSPSPTKHPHQVASLGWHRSVGPRQTFLEKGTFSRAEPPGKDRQLRSPRKCWPCSPMAST